MKIFYLMIMSVIITVSLNAQTVFKKTLGDGLKMPYGVSVQQTEDGGYIIVGKVKGDGPITHYDVYLMKTDHNGDTTWTKKFKGTYAYNDEGYCVQQTTDNGYIIAGLTESFGERNGDAYLIKTDANGDTLWTRKYGGPRTDWVTFVEQIDEGYIMVGRTASFSNSDGDVYLIKTDFNGDTLWTKIIGGIKEDDGSVIHQTIEGGYIICGYTRSFGDLDGDVYLIKTDAVGDTQWTKFYGGTNEDVGTSVQQISDGGYIIAGFTQSFRAGGMDVYLIRTDANGDTLWTRTFHTGDYDYGLSLQQANDGGYVITGRTGNSGIGGGDAFLLKTNSGGDSLWTKIIYADSIDTIEAFCVQKTNDGGYIVTGSYWDFPDSNYVYLIKTDCEGNYLAWDNSNCPVTSLQEAPPSLPHSISCYPNPFGSSTTITFDHLRGVNLENLEIDFFDALGRPTSIINRIHIEEYSAKIKIERGNLPDGIYFYQVRYNHEGIGSGKLIIQGAN